MNSLVQVVSSDTAIALATWAQVQLELGLKDSEQARIEADIEAASAQLAEYCHTEFGQQSIVETFFDEVKGTSLVLARANVSVSEIDEGGTSLVEADDYVVDTKEGIIRRVDRNAPMSWSWRGWRHNSWTVGFRPKVVVTYEAGWILPDEAPPVLRRACIELVKYMNFSRRDPGLRMVNIPGVIERQYIARSETDADAAAGLPRSITDFIQNYRRFQF